MLVRALLAILLATGMARAWAQDAKGGDTPKAGAPGKPDAKDAGGAPSGGAPSMGPPPAMVVLGEARMEQIATMREATGSLRALQRSRIASEEQSRVVRVGFDAGDPVAAGQVLVELDDELASIAVRRDEASVASWRGVLAERQTEVERAQRELSRMEKLGNTGSMSENDLDLRRTAVATWNARVEQARAELVRAEALLAESRRRLDRMKIKAPFAGRIVAKNTEVGQWVNAGDAVAELVRTDVLEARLDAPDAIAMSLKEGESKVRVRVGESEREAVVKRVVPDADPMSRLIPVRVEVENRDGRLAPGSSVIGLIPTGATGPALTVPSDAILRDDAGAYVYANLNGSAIPLRVRVRHAAGARTVIDPGAVAPGMQVIVEGNERIMFPGQPLSVIGTRDVTTPPPPAQPGK